ncbi:putative Patatin-like phospholipase family protein [uncultured Gammaproteobacteria bacterium]
MTSSLTSSQRQLIPAPGPTELEISNLHGNKNIAFSLGGLGGFNNYLAGSLVAAIEQGVEPEFMSCSSGGIMWTAEYIRTLDKNEFVNTAARIDHLRGLAQKAADSTDLLPPELKPLNQAILGLTGLPGIFEPAQAAKIRALFQCPSPELLANPYSMTAWANDMADRLMPAKTSRPTRPPQEYKEIAALLNTSKIGVAFNAFDPGTGEELLFINAVAARWLDVKKIRSGHSAGNARVKFYGINDVAVEAALRLFAYGFNWKVYDPNIKRQRVLVDGAYHRQMILSELHEFETIYSVRPLNQRFTDRMPSNQLETLDLQTELWFNGSYAAQVNAIDSMNKVIGANPGISMNGRPMHKVKVKPIEIKTSLGYFDYFIETMEVYEEGRREASHAFR